MTTLGSWLKGQGFTVDDNNVPYGRESTWRKVEFLMVHHTASDCDASEQGIADYCKTKGQAPPLCQIVLGHSGKVWMTCKERSGQTDPGRASHAGAGSGYGIPNNTMNERCLGIEVQCIGTHALVTHSTQYNTLLKLLASLSQKYKVPVKNIIGHKEWSDTGKVDPRDDMNKIRADVQAVLNKEGEMELKYDFLDKPGGTLTVGTSYIDLDMSKWDSPFAGWENTLVYLNITPTFASGKVAGAVRVRLMREDGDSHAPDSIVIHKEALDENGVHTAQYFTFEASEKGKWTKIQLKCEGGISKAVIGTRYTTKALLG